MHLWMYSDEREIKLKKCSSFTERRGTGTVEDFVTMIVKSPILKDTSLFKIKRVHHLVLLFIYYI